MFGHRRLKLFLLVALVLVALAIILVLNGCAKDKSATSSNLDASDKPITLTMYHWMGTETGTAVAQINEKFHEAYPSITIRYENAPVDQYQSVIKTRFVSGDAPDIIGVFPGTWKEPFVDSGYLMDLSDSPWISRLDAKARDAMTTGGKLYALPVDQNAIGVIYNKAIFRTLHLPIPRSWTQFLAACEKIKAAGIAPLALGTKDLWVTQIIPYAMAPTAIYSKHPAFDRNMYEGKQTFVGSPWERMLNDYADLEKRGYFNKGTLGLSYDQMVHVFATGKAAMMVMGSWAIMPVRLENPDAEIGMFPLPYAEEGQSVWVSSAVSIGIGASSTTRYPEAVKKYIAFWARPEIYAILLKESKGFSTFKDVQVKMDPAQEEIAGYLSKGTYGFLDQKWPPDVQESLFRGIQSLLIDPEHASTSTILGAMDNAFAQNKSQIKVIP